MTVIRKNSYPEIQWRGLAHDLYMYNQVSEYNWSMRVACWRVPEYDYGFEISYAKYPCIHILLFVYKPE